LREYGKIKPAKAPGMTRNTSYRKGRQFEYRVRDYLEDLGFLVVRSPGSRAPFDLLAISAKGPILLIQCKVTGILPPAEWNTLLWLANKYSVLALCAIRSSKGKIEWRRLLKPKDSLRAPQPWVHILLHDDDTQRDLPAL
jgi:Holliday junction resolvase